MKKVLYIIGLTSAVFLLSAAEKQQESWTDFVLGVGQRVVNLFEAGAGAVMHGAQAMVEHPEKQIEIEEEFIFLDNEYRALEYKLNEMNELIEKAYYKYNLINKHEFEQFKIFIEQFSNRLQDPKIDKDLEQKINQLDKRIRTKIEKSATQEQINALYQSLVDQWDLNAKLLEDALNEES